MKFTLVTFLHNDEVFFETKEASLRTKMTGVSDGKLSLEVLESDYACDGCPLDERAIIELVVNSFNRGDNYDLHWIYRDDPLPYYSHKAIDIVKITIGSVEVPINRHCSVDDAYNLWRTKWRNSEIPHIIPIRPQTTRIN